MKQNQAKIYKKDLELARKRYIELINKMGYTREYFDPNV